MGFGGNQRPGKLEFLPKQHHVRSSGRFRLHVWIGLGSRSRVGAVSLESTGADTICSLRVARAELTLCSSSESHCKSKRRCLVHLR